MKKIIIVVITIFFITGIANSDELTDKIINFWKYISRIENDLYNVNDDNSPLYTEIIKQIQLQVDENIYALLSNEIINGRKDFIITTGGNSQYFELCDKMISLSPVFKYLTPISLMPASDKIEPFMYGDIIFRVEDVRVHLSNTESNISLLFLLSNEHLARLQKDYTGRLYPVYMEMLFRMTQEVLGERLMSE
jgi:hypothetical protein